MLDGWTVASIVLLACVLILTIILIGTISIYLSEKVSIVTALNRAIMTTFGASKGPKNEMVGTFYYPLVYVGMFFVTTYLLTEVTNKKRQ